MELLSRAGQAAPNWRPPGGTSFQRARVATNCWWPPLRGQSARHPTEPKSGPCDREKSIRAMARVPKKGTHQCSDPWCAKTVILWPCLCPGAAKCDRGHTKRGTGKSWGSLYSINNRPPLYWPVPPFCVAPVAFRTPQAQARHRQGAQNCTVTNKMLHKQPLNARRPCATGAKPPPQRE